MAQYSVEVAAKLIGFEKLDQVESRIKELKNNAVKVAFSINGEQEIKKLKAEIASLKNTNIDMNIKSGASKGLNDIKSQFQQLKTLATELNTSKVKLAGLDENKNSVQFKVLKQQVDELETSYNKLHATASKDLSTSQASQLQQTFDKASRKIDEVTAKSKDMATAAANSTKPFSQLDALAASNKTLKWLQNNTKAAKKYGDVLNSIALQQRNATSTEEIKSLSNDFKRITANASLEGLTGRSIFDEIGRGFKKIGQFAATYGIIHRVPQAIGDMISQVVDVNTAQTELLKVSDASAGQLSQYWDKAADSAKKYGATISDVISSTADWSRLGYNLNEAEKLSDATTLLQKVGDNMTQESSAEGIISTLKGFQLDADEVYRIVDSVNQVANTQPIDTAGLFASLQKSASSMSAANNSLEETIALITAAKHYWLNIWRHI